MRNNSKKIITRDSWGRPEGDEWFGFDPERKTYTEKHFTYEDKEARYKKKNDEWFVSNENTNGFVPLKDPRGSRARELERNAKEVKRMSSFEASEKESAEEIAKIRDFRNVVEKGSEIFTGFPGKEKNQYEFRNGNWYEPNPEVEKAIKRAEEDYVPISRIGGGTMTSPTGIGEDFSSEAKSKRSLDAIKDIPKTRVIKDDDRVRALNKQFGKNASLDEDYETFSNYDNSPEKSKNKYRVKDGSWERLVEGAEEWSSIENEGSIGALNRRYGKNVEVPKKVKIEEARDISPFLKIDKKYLSQTEESAIKKLYKDFSNLGFEFEQAGMLTDYIKVIPKNSDVEPMTFSFDDPKGLDAARLRQYLKSNAEYDSNNSVVNEIRSNVRTNAFNKAIGEDGEVIEGSRADKVGVSKFIDHNNKYYESKEYKDNFKKLNFVEQKEEIERRQMENKPIENKDIFGDFAVWVGLVDKYQGTPEDLKKLKESEKKLYNSEEYKVIYANKRDEYIKEKNKNNEKLLDAYEIALDSRDPNKIKKALRNIETGTFVATMGNNINYLSKQQQDYSDEIKNLNKSFEKNQDDYRNRKISAEVYQDRYETLESKRDQLKVVAKEIDTDQKRTKRLTGEYITEKAKYGGFWGNLVNEFIVSADKVAELGVKLDPNLAGTEKAKTSKESQIITPEEMKYYKSDALRKGGFTEEEIKNIKINQVKLKSIQQNERMLIEAFGSDLTTEESRQNLGFFQQALVGVAGSLPAMLTRAIPVVGQAAAFVSLADLSMSQIEKEMLTDPDFQTTTAFDRAKVSLPYGIVMGALENFGLNRLTKGQSYLLGKGILGNIAKTLPAGATREVLENIANKEVKNLIGKGVLKVVAGTLAEGETGAIQTLAADIGVKKAYNYLRAAYNTEEDLKKLTGGEAFSTPKTLMEGLSAVGEGALAEAIGGFAMSTVIVNSQLLINGNLSLYNKEDLNFLEDFTSDEQFKKIIVADLKNKMIQGTMTKSQAESALNDIDLVAGVFNSIDENLPESAKMEAFNLINKRNRLEKSIEGKDESLSKSIKEEIKEINDKLTKLPLKVQGFNGIERLKVLEKALKRKRKDKDIIIVEGKKISRTEAETEYKDLDEKIQSIISEFNAPVVETADTKVDIEELKQTPEGKEVERRRRENLSAYDEEGLDEVYAAGSNQTIGEFIKAKYDAELNQINQKQKDAIQEQTAGEVPVQPTTAVGEEVVQGEPTTEPQVLTEEGKAEEKVATLRAEEQAELLKAIPKIESYKVNGKIDKTKMPKTVLAKYNKIYDKYDALISPLLEPVVKAPISPQVNVAPYFNTKIETVKEAEKLRKNKDYKKYKQELTNLATQLGITSVTIDDVIGGYKNDAGEDFIEISNLVTLEGATLDQAEEFAALAATISPEVQEASIAAQYTSEGSDTHNANEYEIKVGDIDGAMRALKEAGISNFSVNETTKSISFIDVLDFADVELQDKIGNFVRLLIENNIDYEQKNYRPLESRYVDKGTRKEILRRIKSSGTNIGQGRKGVYKAIDQAISRDSGFQEVSTEEYLGTGVSIKNKSAVDNIKTKTTDKVRVKVIEAAQRAIKTLQSVLPNFDIVIHENEESYNAAMKDRNGIQGSAGNFSYGLDGKGNLTGRIDINLSKASARTVAHEVAHGVMLKTFGDNPALFKRFRDRIASILKESTNKALMDFANQYVDKETGKLLDVTYEEYLAELTAALAAEEGNLSATTLQKIATLINAIVSKITNGMLKPFEDVKDTKQVIEFFSNIANSIREGQDISNLNDDFSKSLYEPVNLNIKGELENKLPLSNRKPISKSSRGDFNLIPHPIIDKNTMVGKKYSVTMSDHTKVGEYKNDKTGVTVKNLMGGVFYPYIKGINDAGIAWASVTIKAAREMVINAVNQDATLIYRMSRSTGSRGNVNFNEIAFAELIAPVTNGKVTEEEFLRNLNNKLNTISNGTQLATGIYILGKYGVDTNEKIKINKTKTVKVKDKTGKLVEKTIKVLEKNADNKRIYATKNVTKKELPSLDALKKALSEESFSKRGGFWSTILKDSWTTKSTGEWYKFLEKYNVTSLEEIVNNLAEPEVDTANDHDIVAAVKIAPPEYDKNGNIKIYTTREGLVNEAKGIYYIEAPDHPSYPYVVKGSPIGVLNEFNSITDYFPIINDWLESGRLNSPYKAVETMGKELVQKLKPTETTFASKAQLVYDETGFISVPSMIEIVKSNNPIYLGGVMEHIQEMGEKLRTGNVNSKDVAKSYLMAVSSIRSGDIGVDKFENSVGKKIDQVFLEPNNKIRTEGAMAFLLTTEEGKRFLRNIELGKVDSTDRAFISTAMKPFGMFGVGESKFENIFGNPSEKQINLTNINEFNSLLKGGIKNESELFDAIVKLKGISQAKVGFVSNFLGIGTRGVIDAREIQGWLRGSVFQGIRTEEEAEIEKQLTKSNKSLSALQKEILSRMRLVGEAFGIDPLLAEYIGHHMIWDAVAKEKTTHDGLYLAMTQNENDFNDKLNKITSKSQLASDGKEETEAKKITELNKKRDSAQKNTIGKTPKLGDITSDLGPLLKQVLNINAKLIPEDVFEDYRKVIEMLSGNRRILSPENRAEIEKKLNNIIRSIEFSNDKASDLKGRYDDFKVNNEDLDYSDSIKKMLEDGIISKEEFDFMKKYKSKIIEAEVKQKMTKEEDEEEKEELIAEIKDTTVTTDEFKGDEFRLERDFVNKFIETLKNSDLESLNNSDLNDLVKIIYNINNGFVNHDASQMLIKLESNIKEATLVEAIPDSYGGVVRRIQQWLRTLDVNIANIKLRIKNDKYGVGSNSLFNIDEMFGDFKTKRIFNSIFNESAKAQQTYQSEIKDVQGRLIEAENAVFNSFKKDGNALIKSQMKSMLYMIQLEYESNEGSKQTRPALAVLDAVIEFAKIKGVTEMSKQDLKVMQDIKKNFVVDGKIDIDKILSSFNKAEISALKVMQSINEEMTKKATFTSYVINGSQLKPLKNYVPQMVAQKTNQETIDEQINRIKSNINPGTESNNLIERNDFNEKNVSPVILNPYFAINQSSKSLLINYYLADPIRTARMTLKKAELNLKENKKDSEAREMLEVISQSYETALNDLLSQNFGQTNKFIDALAKVGYSSMLASAPRMLSEAISNTFFVMTNNPVDYSVGVSMYGKLAFGLDGKKVLTNLKSKVTARNYSEAGENSAMFDLSALTNRISRKGKMDTVIVNGVVQVYDNVLGRYVNLVSLVANNVVSQPDKVMIKPLWFGSFARRFEKITGETIDFNKIINNDEQYLNKYKDALSKSTDWADSQVVLAGASTNPFMGVLKNVSREDDNLYETAVKNFNRFMNKFMINEYFTIRKGVFAMIGKGDISREDGLLLLAAASQRLFLYGILTRLSSEVLVFVLRGTFNNFADMALGIDDDDEEKEVEKLKLKYDKFDDKKESYSKTLEEMMLRKIINKKEFDLMQNNKDNIQGLGEFLSEKPLTERVMQSVLGSATGMILGRNYGNFTRMWQNYLVEQVNKEYGDDLGIWDGEYDPYKDALAYNPFEGKKIDESTDLLTIISGPYAPHLNFMTTLLKASNKSEPKEERTILTRKKERLRYFIEGSGMLNMLPFYKDFRKSAMDYVYKEVKVEKQQEVNLKEKKIDILKNIEADENNAYEPEDLKHWIKYVEDADYKKKYDDKEEKIVDGILKEYGYKTKTEFEYEDIRGYKKEFGNYSDYSKERKGKSKIENELDDRIEAFKYGEEYKESSRSGRSRSVWGRKKRSKWSK